MQSRVTTLQISLTSNRKSFKNPTNFSSKHVRICVNSSQVKSSQLLFNLHRIFCTLIQNEFKILLNKRTLRPCFDFYLCEVHSKHSANALILILVNKILSNTLLVIFDGAKPAICFRIYSSIISTLHAILLSTLSHHCKLF